MSSGCDIFRIPLQVWLIASCDESYIRIGRSVYISAWASTLLVQLHWAMRRPRFVGRVTGRIPRFFLFCRGKRILIAIWGFVAKCYQIMAKLILRWYRKISEWIVSLIVLLFALGLCALMRNNANGWLASYGDALSGIAAFVSILLLYKTLISQNRSFKQERFEITFFNLLDQRQKVVDSLSFRCEELKGVDFVIISLK